MDNSVEYNSNISLNSPWDSLQPLVGYIAPSVLSQIVENNITLAPLTFNFWDLFLKRKVRSDYTEAELKDIRTDIFEKRADALKRYKEGEDKINSALGNPHQISNGQQIKNLAELDLRDTKVVLDDIGWD